MNKITIVTVIASTSNNNRDSDNRVVGVPDVVSVAVVHNLFIYIYIYRDI